MPPFANRYRRFKKRRDSSLSGGSIFEIEELIVGASSASVPTSQFQPDGLLLVPAQSTPLPGFNMSLPDNGSIPSSSTIIVDTSGSSSRVPKAALRISFDSIANFIPHFDGK